MTVIIPHITQAAAATVINVVIVFLEYTLALALVALLLYFIPPVNSALAWNVIGRSLHASLWPTILHTDSTAARGTGYRVAVFSYLSFAVTVLVAVGGVLMPLGLSSGPTLLAPPKLVPASFVADNSPLGLATSPRGSDYVYTRSCGSFSRVTCPGSSDNVSFSIAPEVVARFNATPYSPFSIEYRRYYNGRATPGDNETTFYSQFSTTESLILRNGIFAVGGLIVDMDNPGIGLWNHTLPTETPKGGMWSQDVMWLEPVSECVDTNLTVDYTLSDSISTNLVDKFNLTDRGGFFNLTREYPPLDRDGQNINLWQHAYKGAVLSNFMAMEFLNNLTRNESSFGRTFPLNDSQTLFPVGKMQTQNLWWLPGGDGSGGIGPGLQTSCEGYGGADTANITNVAVHCYLLFAPPQRSDGGDARLPEDNSTWTQRMFSCAVATRARMQRVQFSFNGTMDLTALSMSRSDIDTPVLWATEKADLAITDVNLLWGRVPDALEGDPTLWTTRSDVFYIPAGSTDTFGSTLTEQTSALPALSWNNIKQIGDTGTSSVMDYTALSNFALLTKFQTLISTDPVHGASRIQNLIWTDLMANNALGTASSATLLVQANVPSIAYDLRFAVPAILLFILWIPLFGGAVFVLITGLLKLSYVRHLLNHTGAGRIALGSSALKPMYPGAPRHMVATAAPGTPLLSESEKHWAKGAGRTPVGIQSSGWGGPYSGSSLEFVPLSAHEK
ncbi:hypothetical protein MVEN_00346800 [Mycena venus]|uniref:Uncharacterized protein n=1 Tax=Mycena venus TaxID=2733690 RepID=A0A8H6YT89_9AGAR|nr:hypothetical protein MVEN_00346800 [Mycena venus]